MAGPSGGIYKGPTRSIAIPTDYDLDLVQTHEEQRRWDMDYAAQTGMHVDPYPSQLTKEDHVEPTGPTSLGRQPIDRPNPRVPEEELSLGG